MAYHRFVAASWLSVALVLLSGCGGGGGGDGNPLTNDGGGNGNNTPAINVGILDLRTSNVELGSAPERNATITAFAKDENNRVVEGANVEFSSDSGDLVVDQATTDASGQAIARLSSGSNRRNRTINVSASAAGANDTLEVPVVGTSVGLTGPSNVALGDSARFTAELVDSEGNGIANRAMTISSQQGNPITASTTTTDASGQVSFEARADNASASGADTLSVEALGQSATATVQIAQDSIGFTVPNDDTPVALGATQRVEVQWLENGQRTPGETITFTTTRGSILAAEATTDGSGLASTTVQSSTAGPATITATSESGISASLPLQFVATQVDRVNLQASSTQVSPNEQSTLAATVLDAEGNPVQDARVAFNILSDNTGGSLIVASGITNAFGQASTTYEAGATSSQKDGVEISAEVVDTLGLPNGTATDSVNLTVGGNALRITLGTGNEILEPNTTQYRQPWAVQVTDASGNAVADQSVQVEVIPLRFRKGRYIPIPDGWELQIADTCFNEDNGGASTVRGSGGLLDPENGEALDGTQQTGEDLDNDGVLEPGNVASTPRDITTNEAGEGFFDLSYPQQFANWVRVRLVATVRVSGTETEAVNTFYLKILADDVNDPDVEPPGNPSPFGEEAGCGNPD